MTALVSPEVRHEFVRANDLTFHVATCGRGDDVALLLHGFPECWYSWRHQMPLLARLGWRVWAPDLRGYGETDKPPRRRDYAIERLLEDVSALIDASGARRVLLAGHDWGGIIAWTYATRRPRPLDRLVVMNLPHPGAGWKYGRSLRQLGRFWYVALFQLPWLPEWLLGAGGARAVGRALRRTSVHPECFSDADLAVFREAALRPGARRGMIHYYRAAFGGGGLARQRALGWPVIETPTLLLWGLRDVALRPELLRGTDEFVRDLTLRILPDASHWVQQDAPETVNAMLEAWLAGRPVPEAEAGSPPVASAIVSVS